MSTSRFGQKSPYSNPRLAQCGNPHLAQCGNPRLAQCGNPHLAQCGNPHLAQCGNPHLAQCGNPRLTQCRNPHLAQCGNPRLAQCRNPHLAQCGNLINSQYIHVTAEQPTNHQPTNDNSWATPCSVITVCTVCIATCRHDNSGTVHDGLTNPLRAVKQSFTLVTSWSHDRAQVHVKISHRIINSCF